MQSESSQFNVDFPPPSSPATLPPTRRQGGENSASWTPVERQLNFSGSAHEVQSVVYRSTFCEWESWSTDMLSAVYRQAYSAPSLCVLVMRESLFRCQIFPPSSDDSEAIRPWRRWWLSPSCYSLSALLGSMKVPSLSPSLAMWDWFLRSSQWWQVKAYHLTLL